MRALLLICLTFLPFALPSGPAHAGVCEDLWYSRNWIMDRAGYCFGTPLGQSYFDTSDCIGKNVTLSPYDAGRVAELRETEQDHGCTLNTQSTYLALDDIQFRRLLVEQPILFPEGEGFICMGYTGSGVSLFAGPDSNSGVISALEPGDWYRTRHTDIGAWTYITATAPQSDAVKAAGWAMFAPESYTQCLEAAG